MDEGTGMLMVDDINMYVPFLHPLAVAKEKKVRFFTFIQYVRVAKYILLQSVTHWGYTGN